MKQAVWDIKSNITDTKHQESFDCMLAEFLLSEGRSVKDKEAVLTAYKVTTFDELAQKQQEKLFELPRLNNLLMTIEMPLLFVLHDMEKHGITLDTQKLHVIGEEIDHAKTNIEQSMKEDIGFEMNLNSSIQIGDFLADKLGVPLSRTKTGRYATNETELSKFRDQFPFIEKLLTYRELNKLHSTYVESLITKVDDHQRIHTTYSQVGVQSGRLSSSNPNLQNIPVTSEYGQKIKSCFVASEGHVLVSFDYSQQELRILAHVAREEKLIDAFTNHLDIHSTTASQIFHVDYANVTKEQRMIAKTINFGIIYGMGSYGMSAQLHIPPEEAQGFIDMFNLTYPNIKTYYDQYLRDARMNRYVETLLGRRRYVFEYPGQKMIDNAMRRVLINFPIQGSAADLMKKAMIDIDEQVLQNNPECHLLLQIHDDLVFEIPDDKEISDSCITKIKTIMCNVYPLLVPVEVDVKVGKNWGEMEKV
jgi:DNA polymerase-1